MGAGEILIRRVRLDNVYINIVMDAVMFPKFPCDSGVICNSVATNCYANSWDVGTQSIGLLLNWPFL